MAVDKNEYQFAGDYTLDGILIVGSSGEKINVISQLLLKEYPHFLTASNYEDLYSILSGDL